MRHFLPQCQLEFQSKISVFMNTPPRQKSLGYKGDTNPHISHQTQRGNALLSSMSFFPKQSFIIHFS